MNRTEGISRRTSLNALPGHLFLFTIRLYKDQDVLPGEELELFFQLKTHGLDFRQNLFYGHLMFRLDRDSGDLRHGTQSIPASRSSSGSCEFA